MRTAIRDSGLFHPGHAPADWLLFPGVSFGPKRDYLYAGDRLALQLDWSEGESPVRQYIAGDHLNSTRAIVDDNGNLDEVDYLPFGGFLTGIPVPDTTHLFTGHERDTATLASNLDYMHARYFSPNLGRFLSVDPVGGEVASSQSWNRYSYVLNNPLALVDPFGELWQETLDSTSPYTWVDTCGDDATCYESVAAPVGANLVVYGSSGATDMATLAPNGNGVIDLAPLSGHPDAGFEFKNGAATFLMADAAAAFWNTATQYQSANPGSQKLLVTDMGAADAANFGPHQTHDLGRSIDLRYQNSMGLNLQDSVAFKTADVDRTRSLVGIASSQGFDQNYTGSISLFGGQGSGRTEYLHMSHIHIGYTRAKALRLFP